MKAIRTLAIAISIGVVLGIGTYQIGASLPTPQPQASSFGQEGIVEVLDRASMIKGADTIFVGRVTSISGTQWNQDSGKYWTPAETDSINLKLFFIDFEVVRNVAGEQVAKTARIVVIGESPVDSSSELGAKVGDVLVVFAARRGIAWRGGTKELLRMENDPKQSYFVQQADGSYLYPMDGTRYSTENLYTEVAKMRAQP